MYRVALLVLALTEVASADQDPNTQPVGRPPDRSVEPDVPLPPPVVRRPVCVEGRPIKLCSTIALVEIGFAEGRSTEGTRRATGILPLQVGLLVNISDHTAVGATLGLVAYNTASSTDPPDANNVNNSFGAFVRYRRWLVDWSSIDVSIGAASNGAIAEVALQLDDVIAITAGVHQFPFDDHREVAGTVGLRFGAYLIGSLVATVANAR